MYAEVAALLFPVAGIVIEVELRSNNLGFRKDKCDKTVQSQNSVPSL